MQWIRANRRFGAWCALVAIALQVVLSYGHTHRIAPIRSQPQAAISGAGAAIARHDPAPPQGAAFEYCAVCAVIEMAATAVPPQPPVGGLPDITGAIGFALPAAAAPATVEHRLFQARAPPQAV